MGYPMTIAQHLESWWRELNARYFRNALPPISIQWSRRLTASAGLFVNEVGPRAPDLNLQHRYIRLSAPLLREQPVGEIRSTLAHEMIHQWQFDVLKRRPNHGPDFHRLMARMNRDGLGLTIRHGLNNEVLALAKYTWQCAGCGALYHRHRRSIRPSRHLCGSCRGSLKEVR